jgi:putative transcriptional regulator
VARRRRRHPPGSGDDRARPSPHAPSAAAPGDNTSNSNNDNADDDTPPLTIPAGSSWRDVRAALIAGEAAAAGEAAGPDGDVWSARFTPENVHLLQSQDRALAREALWAHATGAPEAGGLVIASPDAPEILGDDRAWQLVVLVTSHGPAGSSGLILNRPATASLGDLLGWGLNLGGGDGGSADGSSPLEAAPVYLGGYFPPTKIARQPVTLLHGASDLEGAVEVGGPGSGLFTGGAGPVAAAVSAGRLGLASVRIFAGTLTWPPGGLEAECGAGAWIPAAASRVLSLKPCLGLPVPLWVEALTLMGGEWGAMARRGRGRGP